MDRTDKGMFSSVNIISEGLPIQGRPGLTGDANRPFHQGGRLWRLTPGSRFVPWIGYNDQAGYLSVAANLGCSGDY